MPGWALVVLAPRWSRGMWMTRGRPVKGMMQVIGPSELPVLLSGSRLAYLIIVKAHEEGHQASKSTLWRSRAQAWIVGGHRLAARVYHSCTYCHKRRGVQTAVERVLPGYKPFKAICLDFMERDGEGAQAHAHQDAEGRGADPGPFLLTLERLDQEEQLIPYHGQYFLQSLCLKTTILGS